MTDTTTQVRQHYNATDLTSRIKSALATIAAEDQKLRVDQLAPLDQFHTRGILATAELPPPPDSNHRPAYWISAVASAARPAISRPPSVVR